jgi:hypothetical protein
VSSSSTLAALPGHRGQAISPTADGGARSRRFDFNQEVVCPARGHSIPKQELDWTRRIGLEQHLCSIQDPLLLSHDLGRTVTYDTRKTIQRELGRACKIMYTDGDPVRALCEPYRGSMYAREPRGGPGGGGRAGAGGVGRRGAPRDGRRDDRDRRRTSGPAHAPHAKPTPPGLAPQAPPL